MQILFEVFFNWQINAFYQQRSASQPELSVKRHQSGLNPATNESLCVLYPKVGGQVFSSFLRRRHAFLHRRIWKLKYKILAGASKIASVQTVVFNRGPAVAGPISFGFTNSTTPPTASYAEMPPQNISELLPGERLTNTFSFLVGGPGYIGVEIFSSAQFDPDSTPSNLNPYEDDYAQVWVGSATPPTVDLALSQSVNPPVVAVGGQTVVSIELTNLSSIAVSNVSVQINQASNVTLDTFTTSGGSFYDAGSGVWAIPLLNGMQGAGLTLFSTAQTATTHTNIAALTASEPADINGTNNFSRITVTGTNASVAGPGLSVGGTSSGQMTLVWDVASGNFQLLSTTNLNPPINWQLFPAPVYTLGDVRQVSIAATNAMRFFQLVSTPFVLPPPAVLISPHADYLSINWQAVPGATGYNVRVYDQPPVSGMTAPIYSLSNVTNTSVTLTNLPAGQTFYFTVSSVNNAGEGYESVPAIGNTGPYSFVYGDVTADVVRGNQTVTVTLPGISVFASNSLSGLVTSPSVSAINGAYELSDLSAGTYKIFWTGTGVVPSSLATNLVLTNDSIYLRIKVVLATSATQDVVVANLRFADGSLPIIYQPFWDVDVRPEVTLRNAQGTVVASGNVADDASVVLLPAVTTGVSYTLRATMENLTVDLPVVVNSSNIVQVVLPNQPPFIAETLAVAGSRISRALPGSTVQLLAPSSDADGDPLLYEWRINASASAPSPTNSPNPDWILPTNDGSYMAYVMLRDGRGGYAFSRVDVIVGGEVLFAGTVRENDPFNPAPLTNAAVTVNGVTTNTDARGSFILRVPLATNYILQAYAPGHVSAFRIYSDQTTDLDIRLKSISTNQFTVSPGQGTTFSSTSGLFLDVPSDSVQTTLNQNYYGPVNIEFAVYDPCDPLEFLPLPYYLDDPNTEANYLQTLGLAWVELKNPADGGLLRLLPANPGTLGIPIGKNCATNIVLPPILTRGYGTTGGITSTMTSTNLTLGTNQFYVAPYTDGGRFNDFQPRARAKIKVTADRTINFPFLARVTPTLGQPEFRTVFNDDTGLFDAQQGEIVVVDVFSLKEGPGEYFHDVSAASVATPDSDKTIISTHVLVPTGGTNVARMSLTNFAPELTSNAVATISKPEHFLTQGYRDGFNPSNVVPSRALANSYYAAIKAPPTFNQWKELHGFNSSSNLLNAAAQYYNVIDLGFARSMVMAVRLGPDGKTNVAYYVTNYRSLEDAIVGQGIIATVAMDYAALTTNDQRFTKFYVFDAGGALLPTANLDNSSEGEKPVPNLCIICHGGKFYRSAGESSFTPADGNLDAAFLPFDLEAFTYSKARGIQRDELAKMNLGVLFTAPTEAISDFIVGCYGGIPGGSRTNFNQAYLPSSWTNTTAGPMNAALYRDLFKTSCRGCHISRKNKLYFDTPFSFISKEEIKLTAGCELTMPNSQRTFGIFWGSKTANVLKPNSVPNQVELYQAIFGTNCP